MTRGAVAVGVFLAVACREPAATPTPDLPAPATPPYTSYTDPTVQGLRDGLAGFEVQEGYFRRLLPSECAPVVAQTGICLGNNPLAPYLAPTFPEDEPLDEPIGAFQLSPDEAIVMVGFTPESRYFSYQFHLHTRLYDGERRYIVSTLTRSLHNRNLDHAGVGPDSAGQYTAMIWTANRSVAQRVRAELDTSLAAQGIDRDVVNVVAVPFLDVPDGIATANSPGYEDITVGPLMMGYAPEDDIYGIAVRIAGIDFTDPYLDPSMTPMAVFKVRPQGAVEYDPFPYPLLPPPRDATKVADVPLGVSLELLVAAVEDQLPVEHDFFTLRYDTADFDGFSCCFNGFACGNSDDALYMQSAEGRITAESSGGVYSVGVVHTAVPEISEVAVRLAYSGLALRNVTQRMGIHGVYDERLRGTANLMFPEGVPGIPAEHLERLYVWRYARDCEGDPLCDPLGTGPLEVPPEHDFNLTERAYLDLSSDTGPHHRAVHAPYTVFHGSTVTLMPSRVDLQ